MQNYAQLIPLSFTCTYCQLPSRGFSNNFFCRYVPPQFSKVGSTEQIFWPETRVSGTNFCLSLCLGSWNLAKISEIELENAFFFKKYNWILWSWRRAWNGGSPSKSQKPKAKSQKKKSWNGESWGRLPTIFQCECPFPSPLQFHPKVDRLISTKIQARETWYNRNKLKGMRRFYQTYSDLFCRIV